MVSSAKGIQLQRSKQILVCRSALEDANQELVENRRQLQNNPRLMAVTEGSKTAFHWI